MRRKRRGRARCGLTQFCVVSVSEPSADTPYTGVLRSLRRRAGDPREAHRPRAQSGPGLFLGWLAFSLSGGRGRRPFFFLSSHCLKHVSDPSVSGTLKAKETVPSREEKLNSLCTSVSD